MISKRQYLKAKKTIIKYEKQLHIGGVVCSAVKNRLTIALDDTWYEIEIDGVNTKCANEFEFN